MPTPAYPWMDRTDPNEFASDMERGFKHYRAEYTRLSDLIVESVGKVPTAELDMMRFERNHAAARVIGFSHHLI